MALPSGLTAAQAAARLREEGPNALPRDARGGLIALLAGVLREPMFLLLIAAAAIYLLLGDVREALVLAASIVVIIAITVVQERRTERALEALRDLSSPRALVVRDGREARIAGAEVVRGDLLLLREGDRVAADVRLGEANDLMLDESLLTGESVAVAKEADGKACAYSGTLVVRGTGSGEVAATGTRSEMGRIGALLAQVGDTKTSLERETARIVRYLAAIGLTLCVAVALLYYLLRGDALAGILAGLTLAMSLLPEEFPVVLTVFLALGAWRIARQGVLTRRLPAVEMLGAATVLCCDKTGTLTENRMSVVGERDPRTVEAAAMACEASPFDPMERAILDAFGGVPPPPEKRYPMSPGFPAVCHARAGVACIKGAPETVLALCGLPAQDAAAQAASRGLRVLGVARAEWSGPWPEDVAALPFTFVGFIALADPLRPSVPGAVALCRQAGIRVIMITGDHPETARAIAAQAGLDASAALTGAQIDAMDDAALRRAVGAVQVFARVRPEQKLRLVNALRDSGEVVAMTGDGVNDAPALKAAHIGIAMGRRGTDVAREAAALVLLEDDFTSIVRTVRLGRRIYDNIRNAMRFLLAVHVPLAGMALLPLLLGWPLFVFPVHVVFLEFVIDPACALVFESERTDPRAMQRPPRDPQARLFDTRALALGVALGAGVLAAVALVFGGYLHAGADEARARAAGFATMVIGVLALIAANRSSERTLAEVLAHPNRAMWWVVALALLALAVALYVPAAAALFRFAPLGAWDAAIAAAAGLASVAWFDLAKLLARSRN
jgi:Ca2+-transporting ATPase